MKRHPALVPLSHDHHHGLVAARRLGAAADEPPAARLAAARAFVRFFGEETSDHFRSEEELLFPLLESRIEAVRELLARTLVEHVRLRGLVRGLALAGEREQAPSARAIEAPAALLHDHIRLEERELFPAVERLVPDAELDALELPARDRPVALEGSPLVDLTAGHGEGPLWGTASQDLNATLLAWPPGGGVAEHVNEERDVLFVAVRGSGRLLVDGQPYPLAAGRAVLVPRGSRRTLEAGPPGLRCLTAHLRRAGLRIGRVSRPA